MKTSIKNEFTLKSPDTNQCDMKEAINFHWTSLITTNLTDVKEWIYTELAY